MSSDDLAFVIRRFLDTYATRSKGDSGDWSTPDATALETAATELENFGDISRIPQSNWDSGGFKPRNSTKGRTAHGVILAACQKFLNED